MLTNLKREKNAQPSERAEFNCAVEICAMFCVYICVIAAKMKCMTMNEVN